MVSRPEIEGERLLKQLLAQSQDFGGAFAYITGSMGGGKTSAMFSWLLYTLLHYSDQKLFLSETYNAPLQCFKLDRNKLHFMVMDDSNVIFRDRNNHLAQVKLPVTTFKSQKIIKEVKKGDEIEVEVKLIPDFDDLYEKAKPGLVNVVFFGNRFYWMDFIAYLRHTGDWSHVFIDELGEITPAGTSGRQWKSIGRFANFTKDLRKCMIKVICNTQSVRDSDYRIQDKFMFRVFLPGAMSDGKHSRVSQSAIDNLISDAERGNFAYIDSKGKFGLIQFKNIFKPNKKYNIEAYIPEYEEIQNA